MNLDKFVGMVYNRDNNNCVTLVAKYYRELGYFDVQDGQLREFNASALLWLKKHFVKATKLEKHCLILVKNLDGTLHVAVYDSGGYILHNSAKYGGVLRQHPALFFAENKNTRIFKWRQH